MNHYFRGTALLLARSVLALSIAVAAPVTAFGQSGEVPKPVVDLKPATANYKLRIEADGEVTLMDMTRTTKAQKGLWVVNQTMTGPGFTSSDETTYEKKTLIVRSRLFHLQGAVFDLRYAGHKATGTITDGGKTETVDADLGGVAFADGAGNQDVLAALPLAKGYTVEFRNFNVSSRKVNLFQLRVMDTETVSVPAGTFDTWKVLISSLDGGSNMTALWVDKRTHRVVKTAQSMPHLNNSLATAELTK